MTSKIVRRVEVRDLCHIVKVEDKYYYIDSVETFDLGFETMVFECDELGAVEDWGNPVYVEWHIDESRMELRHSNICKNLAEYL